METAVQEQVSVTYPVLNDGEVYSGIILGKDGERDYHLVKLPGAAEDMSWKKAGEWAQAAGGELPNMRELGLLRVNARQHFKQTWYWSSEQHASDSTYAWCQLFGTGSQRYYNKSAELCAVAVRRVFI